VTDDEREQLRLARDTMLMPRHLRGTLGMSVADARRIILELSPRAYREAGMVAPEDVPR